MRILIADDEPIIRLGLKAMLQELGHEVLTAMDGREALQMVRHHRPDLAILDIKMPYTDGLQAARTLARSQPLPVILLTAYSEQDLIDRAADAGIHGYLVKPVGAPDLAAAIAVAARRFSETQALRQRTAALEEQLETRKLVERAKGHLVAEGMSEAQAYRELQDRARRRRRTMREIAEEILKTDR
jgi:response regulator NasT